MTKLTIAELADEALFAFWEVVVRHNPEAKTGDLSPLTTVRLTIAAENAIKEWIWANVPSSDPDAQSTIGGSHD
jgi:hypothetical protein